MFWLITVAIIVSALLLSGLFIAALVFYVKKRNSQAVSLYVNGKKVKVIKYEDVNKINFPKEYKGKKWYFDKEEKVEFLPMNAENPIFDLYTSVEQKPEEQAQTLIEKQSEKVVGEPSIVESQSTKNVNEKVTEVNNETKIQTSAPTKVAEAKPVEQKEAGNPVASSAAVSKEVKTATSSEQPKSVVAPKAPSANSAKLATPPVAPKAPMPPKNPRIPATPMAPKAPLPPTKK